MNLKKENKVVPLVWTKVKNQTDQAAMDKFPGILQRILTIEGYVLPLMREGNYKQIKRLSITRQQSDQKERINYYGNISKVDLLYSVKVLMDEY